MANRFISLTEELNNKLKQEDNASALISVLLVNHYNLTQSPKDKLDEIKKEIEIRNQQVNSLQIKVDDMEKKKDEIVEERIKEESVKEDTEETWNRRRALQKEAFNNYMVDKDTADELFNEFFGLLRSNYVSNIVEFMLKKGIKRKEKKRIY